MTERDDPTTKNEPSSLPSDLLHDSGEAGGDPSGEAGGDPDSHLGASRDHVPRAEDDGPATAKLQRTPGQDADNDKVPAKQDAAGVAPS